jgi:hypothetical protein|tara:strand:- start:6406 stop:6609 length:204 start_codon:yes stop_codon:yes gene_type:complete
MENEDLKTLSLKRNLILSEPAFSEYDKETTKLKGKDIDAEIEVLGRELADLFKAQAAKLNRGIDPKN